MSFSRFRQYNGCSTYKIVISLYYSGLRPFFRLNVVASSIICFCFFTLTYPHYYAEYVVKR